MLRSVTELSLSFPTSEGSFYSSFPTSEGEGEGGGKERKAEPSPGPEATPKANSFVDAPPFV